MSAYETLEHGEGMPLLFLHGMMGKPRNWEGVFAHLPAACRAVALLLPFFRENGVRLNSVPAITDYVEGYITSVGLEQTVLCGNSLGGHVALDLALRLPDRVSGLVLTGSSGLFERTFGTITPSPSRDWVRRKIEQIFYEPRHATDELVDSVVELISNRRNTRDLIKIAKSAKRDNVTERLPAVACPVLLLWGRDDTITPPSVAEEFAANLPDAETVWIERCGHAAMIERPQIFGEAIGQWWRRRIVPTQPAGSSGASQ